MTDTELQAASGRVRDCDALRKEAELARNDAIRRAVAEGRTKSEVARITGLTQPRVTQIVASRL
jgi:hypothetical protein